MISLAYMITILFAIVAVSQCDDSVHESKALSKKWLNGGGWSAFNSAMSSSSYYGGSYLTPWMSGSWSRYYGSSSNIYGYRIFPSLYSPRYFTKEADKPSVSRRAISLDADQLYRRGSDSDEAVSCVNNKGVTHEFLKSDCLKAATKLADKQVSSASCGQCTLSLVTPNSRVAPKSAPSNAFTATTEGILKACSERHHTKRAGTSAHVSSKNGREDMALVLSKNDTPTSC